MEDVSNISLTMQLHFPFPFLKDSVLQGYIAPESQVKPTKQGKLYTDRKLTDLEGWFISSTNLLPEKVLTLL